MKLYGYYRSSAAYRLRIALNLKGLSCEHESIHLAPHRLEQNSPQFMALNPQGLVPVLELDDGAKLTQSLAIIDYLEDIHPTPPLLPKEPLARAKVRALAQVVACDIHPVNNARILRYLTDELDQNKAQVAQWVRQWITPGFSALEAQVGDEGFCFGASVSLADLCLIPQIYNARRFDVDMSAYPKLSAIDENCQGISAFADAAPERQPDAE